jgi:hypothetical protein
MDGQDQHITITDIRIPFIRLVAFFIKATLAAIPATIVIVIVFAIIGSAVALILGGNTAWMMQRWSM